MTTQAKKTFGEVTRSEREAKGIGLRQMAKMINVSPTYLSQVERGVFAPPTEDKVKAMAEILGRDADELLALAGRVPSDVSGIIIQYPRLMALLRDIERFVAELTDEVGPLHELGSPEWITEYAARLEADPTLFTRVFGRAKHVEHLSAALTSEAAKIHDWALRNLAEASLAKNKKGADKHRRLGRKGCSTMDEAQTTPTLDVARRGQIAAALAQIQTVIVDGLQHGFFEYSIVCDIVSGGKRQLVLRAGKSYKFTIPQDEVPR